MNDLDLHAAARAIDLPPGDVDAVVTRGAARARRRHRAVAGGVAAAMLAVSAGAYTRLADRADKQTPVTVGNSAAQRGEVDIVWERADVRSGLGFTPSMSGDALYAVATAPGRGSPTDTRRFVWHSADGIEWAATAELHDLYLSDLADRDSRVYGVGTGPATAVAGGNRKVSDLMVGWSDDGGRNWSRQALPVDLRAIATKTRSGGVGSVDVAATDRAVVAVASLTAELDVPRVLPDGQTAPHGWAITDTGVDVLGDGPECPPGTTSAPPGEVRKPRPGDGSDNEPPGRQYPTTCYSADGTSREVKPQESRGVTASYTWEQLHVDGDLLKSVRGESVVFVADPGTTDFERVDVGSLAGFGGRMLLDTDGDGLLLVGNTPTLDWMRRPDAIFLSSTDGRSWTQAVPPAGFEYAAAIGQLGGRTALVGSGRDGSPTLWTRDSSGSWSATSLATAVDPAARENATFYVNSAAVGPLGVVAAVNVGRDPIAAAGGITATQDGYTLRIFNERFQATVTDSDGNEVAAAESLMRGDGLLRMQPGGSVALYDAATGEPKVVFPSDQVHVREAMRDGVNEMHTRILASRDGMTWSDAPADQLAGAPVDQVMRVVMVGERAVVAATLKREKGDREPARQVALIATPR